MSEQSVEEAFEKLLGRQASEGEKANLYRVRDALGLESNDALWLIVMMLEAYASRLETYPHAISNAADGALARIRETVVEQVKIEAKERARELVVSVPGTRGGEKVALPWTILAMGGGVIAGALVLLSAVAMAVGATLADPRGAVWAFPRPGVGPGYRVAAAIVGAPAGWVVFVLGLPVAVVAVAKGVRMAKDGQGALGWMVAVCAAVVAVGCALVLVQVL